MNKRHEDSTGKRISVGQLVRHKGEVYEIDSFSDQGAARYEVINFVGTDIKGDSMSVDLIADRCIIPHSNKTPLVYGYKAIVSMMDAALADNDIVMRFLNGLKSEWKDKAEDNYLPTDEKFDLREDMLNRLFNEIEYWEKEKKS